MNVIFLLLLIFGSHLVVFRCLLLALVWAQGLMGLLGSDPRWQSARQEPYYDWPLVLLFMMYKLIEMLVI